MPPSIAIQGDRASFHDIAVTKYYQRPAPILACNDFKSTFAAVRDEEAPVAVCAIENSLYGSINQTYDLLLEYNFQIIGEVYLRVEQCLIGLPSTDFKQIREVYSHPVALAQCEAYIDQVLPQAERSEYHDTAASVERVKLLNDPGVVAIASSAAAHLHGLEVLAHSIETNKQNYTRFIVLSKQASVSSRSNKTSLIIETPEGPGSLHTALGVFARRGINLTKLQSRPVIGKAWQYMFYVDIDAGMSDKKVTSALKELTDAGYGTRVLGSYQAGERGSA